MTNFFENYFAILDRSEFCNNSEFPFKRGNEIIYANNQLHLPNSPWFPDIYGARRFLKDEIFEDNKQAQAIPFNEIEENTSISDRTFEYNGNQLLLLSFKETEKMFLNEGRKAQFDDIKKRLLEFLKLNDEIPRLLF